MRDMHMYAEITLVCADLLGFIGLRLAVRIALGSASARSEPSVRERTTLERSRRADFVSCLALL